MLWGQGPRSAWLHRWYFSSFLSLLNSSFIPLFILYLCFCIHLGVHNIIFGQLATIAFTMMEIGLNDDEVFKNLKTVVQIVETAALPLIIFFWSYFLIFNIILNIFTLIIYIFRLSSHFKFTIYFLFIFDASLNSCIFKFRV